ncbi:restriction endonuclease [Tardiphaga sp.]|uniref:restriction endonuclease n=1 Tax=Tardiphaga sp. TaxID=1926292 RepID=UPI00352A0926
MPEITILRTASHIRKLFEILSQHPDGLKAANALKALAEATQLTTYEQGTYASTGGRRFEKIVRFATVDCVKAGWLLKDRGIWTITEAGRLAMSEYPDSEAFYREAIRLYRAWRESTAPEKLIETSDDIEQDEIESVGDARITYEQAEEQAWAEIEAHIRTMLPYDFQEMVADLLKALGYHIAWVSPPGKDGGVDIIAHVDPLGTQSPRIKVQVKRVANKVDLQTLNSFLAIIETDDVGLYVSTGGFTKDAEEAARRQTARKITLIDLNRLVDLWIEAYEKLDEKARRRLPLSPIYFLTPEV